MMTTPAPVDLDNVLFVAGDLRRLCQRAVKLGVPYNVFKQESLEAALAHVQDIRADSRPASGAMARSTACWPTVRARHGAWSTWNLSKLSGCSTDGEGNDA